MTQSTVLNDFIFSFKSCIVLGPSALPVCGSTPASSFDAGLQSSLSFVRVINLVQGIILYVLLQSLLSLVNAINNSVQGIILYLFSVWLLPVVDAISARLLFSFFQSMLCKKMWVGQSYACPTNFKLCELLSYAWQTATHFIQLPLVLGRFHYSRLCWQCYFRPKKIVPVYAVHCFMLRFRVYL